MSLIETMTKAANAAHLRAQAFPGSRVLRAHAEDCDKAIETVKAMIHALGLVRSCPSEEAYWLHSVNEALRRAGE